MAHLHIQTQGSGKELVLLHGWGMHGGIWDGVRDSLGQHFKLHIVDLPGYGESPVCQPYTLENLADILCNTFSDTVNVCGWSLGGQVALTWAASAPDQIQRLALIGTTPSFSNKHDWEHGISRDVFDAFAQSLQTDYEATLKRFLSLQARSGEDARQVMAHLRASLFARGRPEMEALQAGLRILQETDLREQISKIKQPVLLMQGEYDTLAPVAAAHWMHSHLGQAQLAVVQGSAHAPFLSHRQAFETILLDFMHD